MRMRWRLRTGRRRESSGAAVPEVGVLWEQQEGTELDHCCRELGMLSIRNWAAEQSTAMPDPVSLPQQGAVLGPKIQEPCCCTQPGLSCTFSLLHTHQGASQLLDKGVHTPQAPPPPLHTHGLTANIPPRNPRMGLLLPLF